MKCSLVCHTHSRFRVLICIASLFLMSLFLPSGQLKAQTVTYTATNSGLEAFMSAVREQTGYVFFYNYALLKDARPVNLRLNKASLKEALDIAFRNQPFIYVIKDKTIALQAMTSKEGNEKNRQQPVLPKQDIIVSGRTIDKKGNPVADVTIQWGQSPVKSLSDRSGLFTVRLPADTGYLVFTHISYNKLKMDVGVVTGGTSEIVLEEGTPNLDEVVIIGYGTAAKKDLTGSVGIVKVEEMQKAPVTTFDQSLAGRIAGVQVSSDEGQPGSTANIIIRGGNSLTQSNTPLYVIDGFAMEDFNAASINPEDIASITILKDASSTAIYGARGANGVVVIETKKGKAGEAITTYKGSYGFQNRLKEMKLLSPYEFVKMQLEADPTNAPTIYLTNGKTLDSYKNEAGVSWQDKVFRSAPMHIHNVSLRGGNTQTKYSISGSLYDQQGLIINSWFKRYQGQLSIDHSVNKKVKAGANVSYSKDINYGLQSSTAYAGDLGSSALMYSVWGYRPTTGGDNTVIEDNLIDPGIDNSNDYRINPVKNLENTVRQTGTATFNANAYLSYTLLPALTLKITGGINSRIARSDAFYNSQTTRGTPLIPSNSTRLTNGSVTYAETNTWLNENTLNYKKRINKDHTIEVLVGASFQGRRISNYGMSAVQLPNESLGLSGLDEGIPSAIEASNSQFRLASFLGRLNYQFKSRYLFTASMRSDGSSKFKEGRRWGQFPSGAFAWRLSEEKFMKRLKPVSEAKLRVSYGATGNNRVDDFAYLASLTLPAGANYSFNNQVPTPGVVPQELGNADLKWETTTQADIGMDLGLFNNRINLVVDYYRKNTSNLLLYANVPYTTGFVNVYTNMGKVRNEGWEFTLNTTNIQTSRFRWETSFNISFNKNKILALADGEDYMLSSIKWDAGFSTTPLYIAQVGAPAAQFYGYIFDGVYLVADFDKDASNNYVLKSNIPTNGNPRQNIKPGDIKYKNFNDDLVVNADDRRPFGHPLPKHIGGFTNNFSYRNFSLNVFFQWSYGNDIYNANRMAFEGNELRKTGLNQFDSYKDRWTAENPSQTLYRVGGQGPNGVYSSRVLEDGSYLRLKTVSLAYNFPPSVIRKLKVHDMSLNVSLQNVITWTKYSGMDPEVSVKSTVLTPGFDYSSYPRTRTFVAGFMISL